MSETTYLDRVTSDIPDYINQVLAEVRRELPRPPGTRKMTEAEQLDNYMRLKPQDILTMAQKYGVPQVENYIARMEQLKLRRLK